MNWMSNLGAPRRLALAVGILGILAFAVLSLVGTDGDRATGCGRWFNPTISAEEAEEVRALGRDMLDDYGSLDSSGALGSYAAEGLGSAARVVQSYEDCDQALDDRRTMAFSALGVGVIVPGVIVFVAGQRDNEDAEA